MYRKITDLEQQLQKLKVQAYFSLPKNIQNASLYSQAVIDKAMKTTRDQIWRDKYAKKIKSLS